MTPLDAINSLATMQIGGHFWQPYRFLTESELVFSDWLDTVRSISAALIVLFFLLDILRRLRSELEGGEQAGAFAFFIWSALLGAFLTIPGLYWFGARLLVEIGASLSSIIHNADLEAMDFEISNLMKGILVSTTHPIAVLTATLEWFTPVGLLSAIAYYLVIAALYALPFVQSLFLAVFVYLGPLLLPLALYRPLQGVARKWLMGLLGASFISVFGVVAYTAISVSGILTNIAMAGEKHIPSLIYSLTTLAFLLSVVWSSFRLFGVMSLSVRQGWDALSTPVKKLGGL
jgi:hypothetical protein